MGQGTSPLRVHRAEPYALGELSSINICSFQGSFEPIFLTLFFHTSFDTIPDFVFHGYEVRALNYILKPYQEKKIKEVLRDALKELEISTEKYFTVEQKSGTLRLALGQVRYFVSEGRKIAAAAEGERISFYGKLGEVEEELPDFFVRCHNRYLVNLNYVTKLESAALYCEGEKIPVSRSCSQETAAAFARFMLK